MTEDNYDLRLESIDQLGGQARREAFDSLANDLLAGMYDSNEPTGYTRTRKEFIFFGKIIHEEEILQVRGFRRLSPGLVIGLSRDYVWVRKTI